MFGETIDYYILKAFTHGRNIATEEELNAEANQPQMSLEAALRRVEKLQQRLEQNFPIRPDLKYLDIGCGKGDMAIALAKLGAENVTGVDFVQRQIDSAKANAALLQVGHQVKFICDDIHRWIPPHKFDVVLSHEALVLEHIDNPKAFLYKLADFLAPNGVAVLAFGPLFYSPIGDHMEGFFRIPIPWRGVLFSEQAILRLRRECFRPTDPATSLCDITGHLNLMRYSEFLRYIDQTGWMIDYLAVNPQLKKILPLYWLSNTLVRVPKLCDYFASSVYVILRRRVQTKPLDSALRGKKEVGEKQEENKAPPPARRKHAAP
jgi:SAM-dependent methyltransferase